MRSSGTKAFVPVGTRLRSNLGSQETIDAVREVGEAAPYYTKPFSARIRSIRGLLAQAGVRVEKVIQDLGKNRGLYAREGWALESEPGMRIFGRAPDTRLERVLDLVSKAHAAGVAHGHLHSGNIAITPRGEIILFDLSKASKLDLLGKGRTGALSKLRKDMRLLSSSISPIYLFGKHARGYYFQAEFMVQRNQIMRDMVEMLSPRLPKALSGAERRYLLKDWSPERR